MSTLRIHYTSDFNVVLPEKYVEYTGEYYYLTAADLPTPVLRNFEFLGWFRDPEYTRSAESYSAINEDTELFAKWRESEVSIITGIGAKQFRVLSTLIDETIKVDDPNTSALYDLVAESIITESGLSGKDLLDNLDEKVEAVATYVNVHDTGF